MKFTIPGRVAIFQRDAILGLSDDQARARAHQLQALGRGTYRVIGQHVKFRYGEIVDVIDGPAAPTALKDEALALGLRFGLGVGTKTLATMISEARNITALFDAAVAEAETKTSAKRKANRTKAAKARK